MGQGTNPAMVAQAGASEDSGNDAAWHRLQVALTPSLTPHSTAPLLIHSHPSATKQSGLTVKQVVT